MSINIWTGNTDADSYANVMMGLPITVTNDRPKRVLAPDVPVTPQFRAYIDAWMLEFFGVTNNLRDGEVILDNLNQRLHMNPRTYKAVKDAIAREESAKQAGRSVP